MLKSDLLNNVSNLNSYNKKQKEIIDLKSKIKEWKEKAKLIQSNFDFNVPSYIVDEIIEKGSSIHHNYENLYCLINCAVINNRITKEDAKKLKKIYCF